MSIDLDIGLARPASLTPLLPKIATVLAELLGLTNVPTLVIERLEAGRRLPVVTDRIAIDGAPLLLVSVFGEPESISLVGWSDHLCVSMSGPRSSLLYALGAAAAIALAREFGGGIDDDRRFFSDDVHTSPETLLARVRVTGPHSDYREASEKLNWGPAGGP